MKLHTCMISYDRPEAIKRSLASYLETVSNPFSLVVADNGSEKELREWLCAQSEFSVVCLDRNYYPGYACNRGWELAPLDADFLHRADNDFIYREGWCDEIEERFQDPQLGQLGLLTARVEGTGCPNVGGNCVIRRSLWDAGLRYDERPWTELEPGMSEDSFMSPSVTRMGFTWMRAQRECIDGVTTPDPNDDYYVRTYEARRIGYILDGIK